MKLPLFKKSLIKGLMQAQIIEKIHEDFSTASDKLLAKAQEILKIEVNSDKAQRLENLGFYSSKDARVSREIREKQEEQKKLSELIAYYRANYPQKFITEEQVQSLCKKWGLVLGEVKSYIGFVPDKNLREIEAFKIKEEDISIYRDERRYNSIMNAYMFSLDQSATDYLKHRQYARDSSTTIDTNLRICAPPSDFNMTGKRVEGYKIVDEVKDPIVLHPCRGGYLIVTAWGDEASDPIVVNEKMN